VQCGNAEIEKKIEEKVDNFYGWMEKHPNKKGQILLSFYELKNKHGSWFDNRLVCHDWEQWYINLHILQPKVHGKSYSSKADLHPREANQEESRSRQATLEASLHEVIPCNAQNAWETEDPKTGSGGNGTQTTKGLCSIPDGAWESSCPALCPKYQIAVILRSYLCMVLEIREEPALTDGMATPTMCMDTIYELGSGTGTDYPTLHVQNHPKK
ncbi:hypothetical protein Taro_027868, partial [Colocasia esculenta]|nr:hypothetical protein [Colocasia esculenta]